MAEPVAAVEARLNYQAAVAWKPFEYAGDPPPGETHGLGPGDYRTVRIANGRLLPDRFSLDREGFVLRRHATRVADLFDDAAVQARHYPEIEALVAEATGAGRVLIFDHTQRSGLLVKPDGAPAGEPVHQVHNDYTPASAAQRIHALLPDEAEALLRRRHAFINVWRAISTPLRRDPLAVCDARSIAPEDLVACDLIYPERVGETYSLRFNPAHRWVYFPQMQADEVLLIKVYDSDPARAAWSAHSAFSDPTCPPDAPPRQSIEIRTIAFFA